MEPVAPWLEDRSRLGPLIAKAEVELVEDQQKRAVSFVKPSAEAEVGLALLFGAHAEIWSGPDASSHFQQPVVQEPDAGSPVCSVLVLAEVVPVVR